MKSFISLLLVSSICVSVIAVIGCGGPSGTAPSPPPQPKELKYTDHPPEHWFVTLMTGSYPNRLKAANFLKQYQKSGTDIVPRMIEILDKTQRNTNSRIIAARTLGELKDDRAVPVLCKLVSGPTFNGQDTMAEVLGKIGANADLAVPALMKALKAQDMRVRNKALEALGSFKSPKTVDALMTLLDSEDNTTRAYACDSLAKMGSLAKKALPKLRAMQKEPIFEISSAAETAIYKIER